MIRMRSPPPRLAYQCVADLPALGDMLGLLATLADLLDEPVGAARLVDGAALVDGIGQVEPVVLRHAVRDARRQLLAHLGQGAKAMRLEHD